MKLIDAAVRKAKPEAKPYKLADGGGMYQDEARRVVFHRPPCGSWGKRGGPVR